MRTNRISWLRAALGAAFLLVLGACAPEMLPPPNATAVIPSLEMQPVRPTEIPSESDNPPGVEINPRATPAPGTAVPPGRSIESGADRLQVFEPARAYIANAFGVSLEEVVLDSYEEVEWSDGCLGIAEPGMVCPMRITLGYLAFFKTPQGRIETHLDKSGRNFRFIPSLELEGEGSPVRLQGTPGASGIRGQVLVSPACPGPVSADNPCPDQPMQATISVLGDNGEAVMQFQSDSEGNFQVKLPPGKYILHPESPGKLPLGIDQEIVVPAGQYLEIQIHYDSGIR